MRIDDDDRKDVINRLHRVQGQVGAIARMVESDADCREVARQLSAAERALHRAAVRYLVDNLSACLRDVPASAQDGYRPADIERMLVELS
jgi:DNA-binding FrmR family transcriptional regulator